MKTYDIAVVGGGAAGVMAAIRAAELKKRVVLIERNDSIGKKILITGKGRCNLTNIAPIETFIEKFGKQGKFLRSAFHAFFNEDLMEFFRSRGLEMKVERQGRVFPATDKARSIVEILERSLSEAGVDMLYNSRLTDIKKKDGNFQLDVEGKDPVTAAKVILATGGASYKVTGSTGDGFHIAERLKHAIAPLKGGLVPLTVKEKWIKDLQGVALENIRVTFEYGKKKLASEVGELMFTHFGVSGPLVLDLSGQVASILEEHKEVRLFIDLKPGLRIEQLESKLLHKFQVKGQSMLKNVLRDMLPLRLIDVFIHLSDISPERETNQITQYERRAIIRLLKAFPLTVTGSLPIEEAMVTGGGVSINDIDPRTMGSKVVPGLYFAGEIIEGMASSGGYNLQQAFSTGYLAGEKAANA
jgi:predicted Rossmann fold flavoprotein